MFYDAVRAVSARTGRMLYRPAVNGLAHIPASGPVILAANHLSFCDSVVIPLAVPRRVRFLAKAEYFTQRGISGRLARTAFAALGAVPVERGSGGGALEALDTGLRRLKDGGVFSIYPEGTRSPDGRLYRGRTGVAHLALTSGAPVVPVGIAGTDRVQPIGARLPRIAPIAVRFGAPMDFSTGYGHLKTGRARRLVTDEIMAAIQDLTGQEAAGIYNPRSAAD